MIKDIQELNFPSYATMSAAKVSLPDMGEWNITSQIKIDGQIAPDFSFDWEVVHDGHKYIMPLRIPAGSKDNQKPPSVIDLTFQHWAIWQLKRFPFVTMQPIDSGTAVADEEVATVSLNLGDFCKLFAQVLNYYYGDKITLDFNDDPVTGWQYKAEAEVISISHTRVWNVLIEVFHKQFGVRWQIEPNGSYDKYVIKVGYPTTEQSHIFEYGFEGGLMKVERQVQSEEICNLLKGRGGEKNLPYRYFKNVDPENDTFKADPDWIEELANIYFPNLMPATFRSYVQGWKAAHISKYPGYTAVGEANAYAPWAYRKGFTDTKFHPVEFVADEITINPEAGDRQVEILPGYSPFVKKGSSLDKYGALMNSLDNNDEIYPTIQGVTVDPYGRIDEVIEVEPITSDDIEEAAENDAQIATLSSVKSATLKVNNNARQTFALGGELTVEQGKSANLITDLTVSGRNSDGKTVDGVIIESYSVTLKNKQTGATHSASGIPAGSYIYQITANVHNASGQGLNVTVACPTPKLQSATPANKWSSVWRIWVKNIWQTSKRGDETEAQYAERVWRPILGDRVGNEAKVVFASGMLAHEDYEFVITSIPKYERKLCTWQTVEGGEVVEHEYWSEWCIELGKSDAELDTLGVYLPSVMRQAIAGDFFFFTGIDMPHLYVKWGEERVDNWKKDNLSEKKDIKPTWVVQTDRVRLNNEGKEDALIRQLHPGDTLRLADKRFIEGDYETLYLSSLTITYREPTSDDAALNPDVEIVLSDRYEVSANPVATLQGEVSALAKQVGSISNVEQIVRTVADKLYLRKDGLPDRSMSPTEFASLLTSLGFRSGMVGGAGWGIYKDENGNWVIEADRVMARQNFEVNNLVVNQVAGQGGTVVESAALMEITRVEDTTNGYKCYFDQHEGTVANLFHVDDVAWNNRFTPENNSLKFYKRRVAEVGADYVLLSKTNVNGSGIPAAGDVIVQYGNYTDKQRQYVKVRDVVGGGYERYIENLDSVDATGTEYYFVGRQTGMYNGRPRWFIGDEDGFIEWINGALNIKGKLNMLSTYDGQTLGDYIDNVAQSAADDVKAELQAQIDGVIEAWNGYGAPTLSNYPANEWTTDDERKRHDRDIYTDITPYVDDATTPTSGQSWKWYYNTSTDYGWTKIADSEAIKALQLAQMSVTDVDVLYQQTNSAVTPPALPTVSTVTGQITNLNGWSTTAPPWVDGMYMWQTTYTSYGDGRATFSDPTCLSGARGQQGLQGLQGPQGQQGIPGPKGDDGKTSYFHIKYSAVANPTSASQMTETPSTYIGTYVDYTAADSTDPTKYTWARFQGLQGTDGAQGIPGTNGIDGKTSYLHIKYSNDGGATFTPAGGGLAIGETPGDYIGQYTDFTQADSTNPSDYTWAKIKGDAGPQGVPGPPGADGAVLYTWIRYADNAQGGGISNNPTGKKYIGFAYNKTTQTESNTPSDYAWSLIEGPQGNQGVPGAPGADGVTYYTWIKYADNANGTGMYDAPTTATKYIGIAVNKTTATEGTNPADYTWSLFKGADGTSVTISSQSVKYSTAHTATQPADSTFTLTSVPTLNAGEYLWSMTTVTYSNGQSTKSYAVSRVGADGINGHNAKMSLLGLKDFLKANDYYSGAVTLKYDTNGNPYIYADQSKIAAMVVYNPNLITFGIEFKPNTQYCFKAKADIEGITNAASTGWIFGFQYTDDTTNSVRINPTSTPQEANVISTAGKSIKRLWFSYGENNYLNIRAVSVTEGADVPDGYPLARIDGFAPTITSTSVTYAKTTANTQPTDSAFTYTSIGASNPAVGEYLWTKTVVTYSDGSSTKSYSVGRIGSDGTNGLPGAPGADGKTTYVHYAYANSANGATGFSTTYFAGALYVGVCTDYNQADPTTYTSYEWARLKGEDGTPAKIVVVNADATAFVYSNDFTTLVGPTSINLSATLQGVTGYQWSYKASGASAFTNISGGTGSTLSVAATNTYFPTSVRSCTFRCTSGGVYDEITIVKVSSGSNGENGSSYTENLLENSSKEQTGANEYLFIRNICPQVDENGLIEYTVSFDIKASKAGNGRIYFNPDELTSFKYKSTPAKKSISVTTEWERVYMTFTPMISNAAQNNFPLCVYFTYGTGVIPTVKNIKLEIGANSSPVWTPAASEMLGQDAYAVQLTNESHIFEGDTEKAVAASTESQVIAYKGATQVAATIGTITGMPTGMTVAISNNNTTSAQFTVNVTTALITKQGTLTVPVTVDGKTFTQTFSWSLSLKGKDGRGIVAVVEQYALSATTTAPADSDFGTAILTMTDAQPYLWNREKTTYTDNTSETTTAVMIGVRGQNGAAGATVVSVTNYYLASANASGVTTSTAGWTTDASATAATMTADKPYLWNYEVTKWSKGSDTSTAPHVVGRYGQDGASYSPNLLKGTDKVFTSSATLNYDNIDLKDLAGEKITLSYDYEYSNVSTGSSYNSQRFGMEPLIHRPSGSHYLPLWVYLPLNSSGLNGQGKKVGTFTIPSDITTSKTNDYVYIQVAGGTVKIWNVKIERGANPDPQWTPAASEMAAPTLTEQYYLSTSNTALSGGSWQDTAPTWVAGKYIWTRTKIAYATGDITYTDPVCATGQTGAAGQDAYRLDLTKEMAGVSCDAAGTPVGALPTSIINVYKGSTVDSGWTFSAVGSGCAASISGSTLSITSLTADSATATVTATKAGMATLTATMSVYKVRPGEDGQDAVVYQLEFSANSITRDAKGNLSASSLTVQKYKTTGAMPHVATTEKSVRYVRDGIDNGYTTLSAASSSYQIPLPTGDAAQSNALKRVIVELFDGPVLLQHETIPVLSDATEPTENLVKNSEGDWTNSGYLLGEFTTSEDLVIGQTYTFTIWGTPGANKKFLIWDSVGSVAPNNNQLLEIAPGVYSNRVQWNKRADAAANKFRVYNYPSSVTATSTIKRIKVEKGENKRPVWNKSDHDFDYITEALKENTSFQGGVILSSLLRLGYTDSTTGIHQVTAGLNGQRLQADSPALFAGGEMIDKATNPGRTDAAMAMIRHNGTAYFCGNTVRLDPRSMEIGDILRLSESGLVMLINDSTALQIGNVALQNEQSASAHNDSLVGQSCSITNMLYTDPSGNVYPAGESWLALCGGKSYPKDSIISGSGTMSASFDNELRNVAKSINIEVMQNGVVLASYSYILSSSYTSNFSFSNITLPAAGPVLIRFRWAYNIEPNWKEVPGNPIGQTSLIFTSGSISYTPGNQTTLGNNGFMAIWGTSTLRCDANCVIMRHGNFGLKISDSGIQKLSGGNWVSTTL